MKEEEGDAIKFVKVVVYLLPLVLKLVILYLRFKRIQKKKRKAFKKVLRKEGLDKETAESLTDELQEIDFKSIISNVSGTDLKGLLKY